MIIKRRNCKKLWEKGLNRLKLKGAKNCRDLGGLKTTDGRTLKNKMLIRGTVLNKITEKDCQLLKNEYGIATVVDLRTPKEMSEKPDVIIEGIEYIHLPLISEAVVGISHEEKVHSMESLEQMPPMELLYQQMADADGRENLIKILKYILQLPQEKFPLILHCTAGKDRTGVVAALLLLFLGVDKKTVIEDYVKTNKKINIKGNLSYLGLMLAKKGSFIAKKIKNYFLARPEYLNAALNKLEQDFGSIPAFFQQELGFTAAETDEIKNKFLY